MQERWDTDMPKLVTSPNFRNVDDAYAALLEAHEGLSEDESAKLNTKLVLLLANHIGDLAVLEEALTAAQNSLTAKSGPARA
jgi:hypothetical protein